MEERSAADGLEVCGAGKSSTDKGGAKGTREHGGTVRITAPGRAEGRRSQEGADRSVGQGGATGSVEPGDPLPKAGLETKRPEANPRSRVESTEGESRDWRESAEAQPKL